MSKVKIVIHHLKKTRHLLFPVRVVSRSLSLIFAFFFLKHKRIGFVLLLIIVSVGAYIWKWNQKPTLSPQAKKAIEQYKNTFPGEVKSGPSFVIEKQDVLGNPQSYTIKSQ